MLFRAVVFALLGAISIVQPARSQQPVEERLAYVSVLDKAGAPVESLAPAEITVVEDGVQREVLDVKRATEPLQIALLVDTSEAVERDVNNLRSAVRGFIRALNGAHELALYEFGERPTLVADYSRDLARQEAAAAQLFARPNGGAYLLDAIVEASRGLRKREGLRPVVVVISSEGPEFSDRYHAAVVDELRAVGATLHAFVIDRAKAPVFGRSAWEREFTLAEGTKATGGRREYLLTSMALAERLRELAAELKSQYQIVYSRPESLIPPENLTVTVKRAGLTVRGAQAWTAEGWRAHGR
jgi:Ca-activated chloride channel family protein